jgi:hypothetical protein
MLLVNSAHKSCRRWENLFDEDEDGLLWCKLDTLPDNIDKLPNCQILCGEQTYESTISYPSALVISRAMRTEGTRYFFLSMVGISVRSAFSQIT